MFEGRRAVEVETDAIRLVLTVEGGHIAQILHLASGVSPLWIPEWTSVEPSEFSAEHRSVYGDGPESGLVAGLLGHSLCLDLFGAPDAEEAAAGMPVHGEAGMSPYTFDEAEGGVVMKAELPRAQMSFARAVRLAEGGVVVITERVWNQSCTDRPIGWTQHVTLGAPFLEKGVTRCVLSSRRAKVYELDFNAGLGMQEPGAEFEWPLCPRKDGGADDLSVMTSEAKSGGFTAHLMEEGEHAYFIAWSPVFKIAFGYIWRRNDFPWLARWEENHLRAWKPWNEKGFALGMEFGVSPMVESRRKMVERGKMFDTPTYRWVPALSEVSVKYCAFIRRAETMPVSATWDGEAKVELT